MDLRSSGRSDRRPIGTAAAGCPSVSAKHVSKIRMLRNTREHQCHVRCDAIVPTESLIERLTWARCLAEGRRDQHASKKHAEHGHAAATQVLLASREEGHSRLLPRQQFGVVPVATCDLCRDVHLCRHCDHRRDPHRHHPCHRVRPPRRCAAGRFRSSTSGVTGSGRTDYPGRRFDRQAGSTPT